MNRQEKIQAVHMMVNSYEGLCAIHGNYRAEAVADNIAGIINQLTKEITTQVEPDEPEPTDNARNYTAF